MQDQTSTQPKPISALREALYQLDYANDRVLAAERELEAAKEAFETKLAAAGVLWANASEAAEQLGKQVPNAFREGGLLITRDEKGFVRAERLPAAAEGHELYSLAQEAGEKTE